MFGWALTVAYTASGRHAYSGESFEAILGRILFGTADLGPLSGRLREIVVACLAADPADRPTADEVLRQLIGRGDLALPDKTPGGVLEAGAILAGGTPTSHGGASAMATVSPDAVTDPQTAEDADAVVAASDPERTELTRPTVVSWWFPRRSAIVAGVAVLVAAVIGASLWWAGQARTGTGASSSTPIFPSSVPAGTPSPSPGAFSYAGRWTGSAEYPLADLVFSVELLLAGNTAKTGSMRWGANLQCSGRLSRMRETDTTMTVRLSQVTGPSGCYPGTVELTPQGLDKMAFQVARTGETAPRYFGIVVQTP
jgi:eukaryotic-like serine/threonine-protein kinase